MTEQDTIAQESEVVTVCLKLPSESRSTNIDDIAQDQMWISALQRCQQATTSALKAPDRLGDYTVKLSSVDADLERQLSTRAIMATGLPMPKSPSVQLMEKPVNDEIDARQLEREERGGWSLRFRQVFQQMRRQDEAATWRKFDSNA